MIPGCIEYLDLPSIPDDVKQKLLKDAEYYINIPISQGDDVYYNQQMPARYGPDTVYFKYYLYPPVEWVEDILQPIFKRPLVYVLSIVKNRTGNPSMFWPHTDHDRWSGIQINLDNGGDNVITKFWRKFPKRDNMYDNLYDFEDIHDSAEICIEQNRWVSFNPTVCHSVHNVEHSRVTLAVDTGHLMPYDDLLNNFFR